MYLDYNNELIDDGHPLMTQYGSKWVVYLLGAAIKLTDRETWNQNDDVDLAVEQATELIVRLMGYEEEIVQKIATSPVTIHPYGMKPLSPETVTWAVYGSSATFRNGIYSLPDNIARPWIYFRAWLPAGNWIITLYLAKGPQYGKGVLFVDDKALLPETVEDFYAVTIDSTNAVSYNLYVLTDGLHTFTLEKRLKNPSASACYLTLFSVIIGEA